MKKFYTGLFICLMTTATIAQEIYHQIKSKDTGDDKNALFTNQNNPQPKSSVVYSNWETFDNVYLGNPDKLLSKKKANFGLSKNDELLLTSESADELEIEHKRYQQYYKGVKVEGGEYILHSSSDKIWGNGRLVQGIDAASTPSINEAAALQIALDWFGAEKYYWEDPSQEAFIKDINNDKEATYYPKGELLFADEHYRQDGLAYQLLWKFDIYAHGEKLRQYVYVDAITGNIAYIADGLNYCDTEVLSNTINYGQKLIIVDSVAPTTAYLKDCTRGGGVETFSLNNSFSFQNTQPINLWDDPGYGADAQWSTEMTYDFFWNKYGLNSYDGIGRKMVTLIHFGPPAATVAFFSGTFVAIGSGFEPFIELVGHEFSHGVSAYTAGFFGYNETGALNESFSNILGTAIEFWALPESASWMFATTGTTGYNMADPNTSLSPIGTHYPDTYEGNFWLFGGDQNAIVHNNASVQDYCFYLLSDGGSGTNDNGDEYSVNSIGIDKATDIFYRALTVYLTATSEFIDARQATIQSASNLYGACSNEVEQVINAWYAVGVGPDTYTRDLALMAIISPINNCDLSAEEMVEVEVLYNFSGCGEVIPSGSSIGMAYQLDDEEPVVETWLLDQDFTEGETLTYTFSQGISLPNIAVEQELSVYVDYASDDIIINNLIDAYSIERKFNYDGNTMGFEDSFSNLDTYYIQEGDYTKAQIDELAKNTGEKGFLMGAVNWNGGPSPFPEDPSLNFESQKELISEICFCVDAQDWEHVNLYFDMKQTHSGLFMFIYGSDSTEFSSSMRMLINGEQFGEQFHPVTYTDDPYLTYNYSLDQLAGTYFEFCFQSKNYFDDLVDNNNIFNYDTDGDNTYLDNILFADQVFTGVKESETNDFAIYPNPAKDKVYISSQKDIPITEVNIFNQVGQKVLNIINPNNPLDISKLDNGIYIIELNTQYQTQRYKLVKK